MKNEIKINSQGYVQFDSKNWSYAGDKGSWAKVKVDDDGNQVAVVVKRAAKGIISSAYEAEMSEFCAAHGIDWGKVSCGQQVEVEIVEEKEEEQKDEIKVVEQREVEGAYGFDYAQIIIDHHKHGRLLMVEGWGGSEIDGEQYRWKHGIVASILPDDDFTSLDEMINPGTRVIDAVIHGSDDDRRLLEWSGHSIENMVKNVGQ